MKALEPLSSAFLLTGCIYASGVSQSNSFMRTFGINPELSQPSLEKILYDGGIITFEIVMKHVELAAYTVVTAAIIALCILLFSIRSRVKASATRTEAEENIEFLLHKISATCKRLLSFPLSGLLLAYIVLLTFCAHEKAIKDGKTLSISYMKTCYWVEIITKDEKDKACAFRKDENAMWYFRITETGSAPESKPLSEIKQINYLPPQKLKISN
nr:hypothetical protein [uncultured Pseudomonas sp.]